VHGDIVHVASDADAFAAAIRRALMPAAAADVERRVAVAHTNSWTNRLAEMARLIDDAVERRARSDQRWDELLKRAYRRTRSGILPVVAVMLALYVLVFQTNAVWVVAEPLRVTRMPIQSDVVVIFGGGVGESTRAGGGALERVKQAVDLYRVGYAGHLVISSGYIYTLREAEVMRAMAIDLGVPAGAIVLEQHAVNTYDNVRFVAAILREHRWTRALLVTSPYHTRRALLVWTHVAPDIAVVPTPPYETQFYEHDRGASLEQLRAILQEYIAIAAYWKRGWL
jgi:uncharacterized SAM-binding protein YcdF (DUF218 family)